MKRGTILAAAAVLLAVNGWTLVSVSQNRRDARGGRVELTERELRLPRASGESTAIFLELEWNPSASTRDRRDAVPWLDTAKLSELGFDCSVPAAQPNARDHYRAQMTALVYLVFELQGEASEQTGADKGGRSRFFAVDAGRDPVRLRGKYPDTRRHVITRGLIRLVFRDRAERNSEPLAQPRVEGRIVAVLPGEIYVPPPYNKVLAEWRRRDTPDRNSPDRQLRYVVTVSWGADYQPWITELRMLPRTDRETKAP
jgi:hypothetical protein